MQRAPPFQPAPSPWQPARGSSPSASPRSPHVNVQSTPAPAEPPHDLDWQYERDPAKEHNWDGSLREHVVTDVMCCALPTLWIGYFVCLLTLAEGIWVAWHVYDWGILQEIPLGHGNSFKIRAQHHSGGMFKDWDSLGEQNPFHINLWNCLKALVWGDVVSSVIGWFGIFACTNEWDSVYGRHLRKLSCMSVPCVTLLFFWRVVVTFGSAPWMGVTFAHQPPFSEKFQVFFGALVYCGVNLYVIVLLVHVLRMIVEASSGVFLGTREASEERRRLLDWASTEAGGEASWPRGPMQTPAKQVSGLQAWWNDVMQLIRGEEGLKNSIFKILCCGSLATYEVTAEGINQSFEGIFPASEEEQRHRGDRAGHGLDGHWAMDPIHAREQPVKEPMLFPWPLLAGSVVLYNTIVALACFVCLVLVCQYGITVGGWAFFLTTPWGQATNTIAWIQVVIYVSSVIFGTTTVMYIQTREIWGNVEAHMSEDPSLPYDRALELATAIRRRSTDVLLLCFFGGAVRVASFIPITGMVLGAQDSCSFHMKAFSGLYSSHLRMETWAPLRCSGHDVVVLIATLVILVLDVYFLSCHYKLWASYHAEYLRDYYACSRLPGPYGAADKPAVRGSTMAALKFSPAPPRRCQRQTRNG